MLEMLELTSGRRKQFPTHFLKWVHRAAYVEEQEYFDSIMTFRNHLDIEESSILGGRTDGVI